MKTAVIYEGSFSKLLDGSETGYMPSCRKEESEGQNAPGIAAKPHTGQRNLNNRISRKRPSQGINGKSSRQHPARRAERKNRKYRTIGILNSV